MADLLSTISGYLTPEMLAKAAALLGESPAATQKSAGLAVPTILSGLASLASSDTGASQLVNMISKLGGDGNILNELGSLLGGGPSTQTTMTAGRDALQTIFGGKMNGVIEALAGASGVKQTSASSLLSLLVPLVLGVLGRERKTAGLDAAGLASLLRNQRGSWASLLPGALSTLLGAAGPAAAARPVAPPPPPPAPASSPMRWLIPLALLGLIGAWLGSRGCGDTARDVATTAQQRVSRVALPGGANLDVREGGFHYNLSRYLGDTADTNVPRTFVFEDLNFETGSAALQPDSRRVVEDLIVIMKAYPTARGRLEGHTDNTGDAAANKTLSDARARTVRDAMVAGGIDAARLDAAGFGQERPVASNDSEEGRAKNRRTELVITGK